MPFSIFNRPKFIIEIDNKTYTTQEDLNRVLRDYSDKKLDFKHEYIGVKGAKALAGALQQPDCKVTTIDLEWNKLGSDGAKALAGALQHPECKVTTIGLGYNNIGDKGAEALAEALKHPECKVTHINLEDSKIGSDGVEALALALQQPDCKVTHINLEYSNIGIYGIKALAVALQHPECKVTTINLCWNKVGNEGAKALAGALGHPECKVTNINLWNNNISDEGANALAGALGHPECKVTHINLSDNNIGSHGAKALAAALKHPESKVTNISLYNNDIGSDGAKSLALALQHPDCKVTDIDLAGNEIGSDGAKALAAALGQSDCKVTNINLQDCSINFSLRSGIENMVKKTGAERQAAYEALKRDYPDIQTYEDEMRETWASQSAGAVPQLEVTASEDTKISDVGAAMLPQSPAVAIAVADDAVSVPAASGYSGPPLEEYEVAAVRTAVNEGGGIASQNDLNALQDQIKKAGLNDAQSCVMTGMRDGAESDEDIRFLKHLVKNGGDAFKKLLTNLSEDAQQDEAFGQHLDAIVNAFNQKNLHLSPQQKDNASQRMHGFARSYMKALTSMQEVGSLMRIGVITPEAFTQKQKIAEMFQTGGAAAAEFEPTGIAGMILGTVMELTLGEMISSDQKTLARDMGNLENISDNGRTGTAVTKQIFAEHVLHMTEHMAQDSGKRKRLIGDNNNWKSLFKDTKEAQIDDKMGAYFGRAMQAMTTVAQNIDNINAQSPNDVVGEMLYENANGNGTVTPVDHGAAMLSQGALTTRIAGITGRSAYQAATATLKHHQNMVSRGFGRATHTAQPNAGSGTEYKGMALALDLTEDQREVLTHYRQPDIGLLSPASKRIANRAERCAADANNFDTLEGQFMKLHDLATRQETKARHDDLSSHKSAKQSDVQELQRRMNDTRGALGMRDDDDGDTGGGQRLRRAVLVLPQNQAEWVQLANDLTQRTQMSDNRINDLAEAVNQMEQDVTEGTVSQADLQLQLGLMRQALPRTVRGRVEAAMQSDDAQIQRRQIRTDISAGSRRPPSDGVASLRDRDALFR